MSRAASILDFGRRALVQRARGIDVAVQQLLTKRLAIFIEVLVLFGAFYLVKNHIVAAYRVQPQSIFTGPVFLVRAFSRIAPWAWLFSTSLLPFLFWRRTAWRSIEDRPRLRWLLVLFSSVVALSASTYDYNLWFGHLHMLERMLCVVFAMLVVWHPAFVGPLFALGVIGSAQFGFPLVGYGLVDKRALWDAMILFILWLNLRALFLVSPRSFLFTLLVLIGASYWFAARAKVVMTPGWTEWAFENNLGNIFISAHLNGWLPNLSLERAVEIGQAFRTLAVPLQLTTLTLEACGILLLFSRRLAIVLLLGFIAMHGVIFASTGILFWKWIAVDVGVAAYLWTGGESAWRDFRGGPALLAVALIATSPWTVKPPPLGWFDSPLSSYYRFWAVLDNGERKLIARNAFAPYDVVFSQNRFHFLSPQGQLTGTLGAAPSYAVYKRLVAAGTTQKLERLRRRAVPISMPRRTAQLDRFLVRFFQNLELTQDRPHWPSGLSAPLHIWSWAPDAIAYDMKTPVRRVEVQWLEQYYKGDAILTVHDEIVHTVEIPTPTAR